MGREVEMGAQTAILTNDNPRDEEPEAIIRDVLDGFENKSAVEIIPDRVEAIRRALSLAKPGDCVLIAGKGHESHQIIGAEQIPLDDREVAREYLYSLAPNP
jgi:UDP-N-acetylmuramoyl-L-alanyl-D-glutamate--2,6-diaminopimelate ligase